jgi:hypothetical protein
LSRRRRRIASIFLKKEEQIVTNNMGSFDRLVRIVAGLVLVAWAIWGTQPWHMVGWVGVILLGTALFNWCPLYTILGISTKSK